MEYFNTPEHKLRVTRLIFFSATEPPPTTTIETTSGCPCSDHDNTTQICDAVKDSVIYDEFCDVFGIPYCERTCNLCCLTSKILRAYLPIIA